MQQPGNHIRNIAIIAGSNTSISAHPQKKNLVTIPGKKRPGERKNFKDSEE